MQTVRVVLIPFVFATFIGCGDESDNRTATPATSPTTTPAAASAGTTIDAAQRDKGSGARATGGLIDAPPATQPAAP